MHSNKTKIVVTGGTGRFAQSLKKNASKYLLQKGKASLAKNSFYWKFI